MVALVVSASGVKVCVTSSDVLDWSSCLALVNGRIRGHLQFTCMRAMQVWRALTQFEQVTHVAEPLSAITGERKGSKATTKP
jgi:hypothetical protein